MSELGQGTLWVFKVRWSKSQPYSLFKFLPDFYFVAGFNPLKLTGSRAFKMKRNYGNFKGSGI